VGAITGIVSTLNIVVAVIVTEVVRVLHLPPGKDETQPADYREPSGVAA